MGSQRFWHTHTHTHTHTHRGTGNKGYILLKANLFSPSVSYFYLPFPVSFSPFLTYPLICNSSASVFLRYLHASIHIASFFLSLHLILFLSESGKEAWAEKRLVSLGPLLHGSPSTCEACRGLEFIRHQCPGFPWAERSPMHQELWA